MLFHKSYPPNETLTIISYKQKGKEDVRSCGNLPLTLVNYISENRDKKKNTIFEASAEQENNKSS